MALLGDSDAGVPPYRELVTRLFAARAVFTVFYAWLGYRLLQAVWNISPFHPLGRIPGPKLAGATYLLEFYYDVILFGRYTNRIRQMHEQYGPIVRINPHEVHCNDPSFIDEIYAVGGRKRDKPQHQVDSSANSFFATADHDLHRMRRLPLAKFFSRAQVPRLEPEVQALAQQLCDKLLSAQRGKDDDDGDGDGGDGDGGPPIDVAVAYSCFTADVISGFCFGERFGFLAQEAWEPNFRKPLFAQLKVTYITKFFPVTYLLVALSWFADYMPKDMALLSRTLAIDIPNQIKKTKAAIDSGIGVGVGAGERPATVFGQLLQAPDLPASEKSVARLRDEAAALLGGGTETASWTLAVLTYHLLARDEVLAKLARELRTVVDDPRSLPSWMVLEKLPYLGAVIHEGLRLSYGVSNRTARVPTGEDLVYRGEWTPRSARAPVPVQYVIPRGFAIGMSPPITHHDERVFPDSYSFIPERWLDEKMQRRKELEHALLAFSRGSRICVGMNLALCELYLALTALTLRVFPHMRLFETTEDDVRYDHDMFVPMPRDGSKGVRVKII